MASFGRILGMIVQSTRNQPANVNGMSPTARRQIEGSNQVLEGYLVTW